MAVKMTNCSSIGGNSDGIKIEGDMDVEMSGIEVHHQGGDGISMEGSGDWSLDKVNSTHNKGTNIHIKQTSKKQNLLEAIGLDESCNTEHLAQLIKTLSTMPNNEKTDEIKKSGVLDKWVKDTDRVRKIIVNLTQISKASAKNIQDIVEALFS